uniref:Uncharacterized protein n=1 Tax=Tanacetum cinerariifolium TaxID=118510 RepID=A0A6L2NNB7_TANCI|nr:hypothetical protein [Tanacetum cinerariifolium]
MCFELYRIQNQITRSHPEASRRRHAVANGLVDRRKRCCCLKFWYDVKVLVDATDVDRVYEARLTKVIFKSEKQQHGATQSGEDSMQDGVYTEDFPRLDLVYQNLNTNNNNVSRTGASQEGYSGIKSSHSKPQAASTYPTPSNIEVNSKVSNESTLKSAVVFVSEINASNAQIFNIDVVADLFGVPLNSCKDINEFTKDLELGKYELWSELTKEKRLEITDTICNRWDALLNEYESVNINKKSTSYVGTASASAKDQPKVNSNFRPLVADPVFDGVNIFIPRKVVEKMAFRGNTRAFGSFREETDKITDLHQILEEVLLTDNGDGVASIKRRRRDLSSDGIWNL